MNGPTVVELTGREVTGRDEVLVHPPLHEVIVAVEVEYLVIVTTWVPEVETVV